MKKLILIFFVLWISFSFGQSKQKQTSAEPSQIIKDENPNLDFIVCTAPSSGDFVIDYNAIYNTAGVEVKPEFPGGWTKVEEFIKKNFVTPIIDGERIIGKVSTIFIIEKDGSLSNIKVVRDVGFGTDKEAIRVLKIMPKWISAKYNGLTVRCLFSIPIQLP